MSEVLDALRLCEQYFELEILDDPWVADGAMAEAYQAVKSVLSNHRSLTHLDSYIESEMR
jgi:hypothetical protein